MNRSQTFQEFVAIQNLEVPILNFVINLLLTAVVTFILSRLYIRFGNCLSNRKMFSSNFVLISMATMLVITLVKSSLALSLGLVGALSIVRFRAAIKEPEELVFLFIAITIGLGFGANQRIITIIAFIVISVIIILRKHKLTNEEDKNLFVTIRSLDTKKVNLEGITSVLKSHCVELSLKRFDESKDDLEVSYHVVFDGFDQLSSAKNKLQEISKDIKITVLENRGIGL